MATNPVTSPDTTSNPIAQLADTWHLLSQLDAEDIEIHRREEEAHRRKEALEAAVLAIEPHSVEEALSVLALIQHELWAKQLNSHWRALLGVARWLKRSQGAESPLWDVYVEK
jgi:hypothetical protein